MGKGKGKAKTSRKGKKAWRKNISSSEHEAYVESKGRDERSGGPLDHVPSHDIFYVDTSRDAAAAAAATAVVRKVDKHRSKTLRCDSILNRSSLVPPLPWPAARRKKVSAQRQQQQQQKAKEKAKEKEKEKEKAVATMATEGPARGRGLAGEAGAIVEGREAVRETGDGADPDTQAALREAGGLMDLWVSEDLAGDVRMVEGGQPQDEGSLGESKTRKKKKKQRKAALAGSTVMRIPGKGALPESAVVLPAVEVDAPGCSFNPAREQHQEVLAVAVAREVLKEARKELEPQPPPLALTRGTLAVEDSPRPVDSMLGDDGDEDVVVDDDMYDGLRGLLHPERAMETAQGSDEEGEGEEEGAGDGGEPAVKAKPVVVRRLTRADLNRRLRRRQEEAALAARRKEKKLLADAQRARVIGKELEAEAAEAERRRQRRIVARLERRKEAPPRLGKHRYEPEPVEVMLTDEITGSLRQIKGCYTLARERFKSFQKRGLLEPRVPVKRKAPKRRKMVEQGSRGRVEREMHNEVLQLRALRKAGKEGPGSVVAVE